MTNTTASALPRLDAGDGITFDREAAIRATRLQIQALRILWEDSRLSNGRMVELADQVVAHMLGGDHWMEVAEDLVEAVLSEQAGAASLHVANPDPALDALWARLDVLHDRLDALRAGRGNPGDNEQELEREIEAVGVRCREIATYTPERLHLNELP